MRHSETSVIGDTGESKAIFEFTRRGIPVSIPLGNNLPYDLIIDDCCGSLYKVQVKTISSIRNGKMHLSLTRTYYLRNSGNGDALYTKDDVDLFFLYCLENDDCILVPFKDVQGLSEANFRYTNNPPLNTYPKVRYVEDFYIERTFERMGYIIT